MGILIYNILVGIGAIAIWICLIIYGPNHLIPFFCICFLAWLVGLVLQNKRFCDKYVKASSNLVIINILLLVSMLSYPNFIAMQNRTRDSDVKDVARSLRTSVEAYKGLHSGERPVNVREVEGLLPEKIKNQKNPFNHKQTYNFAGKGLVDGKPTSVGQVGYIAPSSISDPYVIEIYPKREYDSFSITEKVVKIQGDSSSSKRP